MSYSIQPMSQAHLPEASRLLAQRHRRDRLIAPELSPAFGDPHATLPVLQALLNQETVGGVVALQDGHLAGYLCGSLELRSPTRAFAGFMLPRSTDIPYAGYATAAEDEGSVIALLYAALARDSVARGLHGHYVTAPSRPEVGEIWADLGFGRFLALGARATAATLAPLPAGMGVRRATLADEDVLQEAMVAFFRTFADSPIFVPFLPETAADRRHFVATHLADDRCPVWLACGAADRLLGFQFFVEPPSPLWDSSALESPPRALYLHIAYTAEDQRSTGVGAALLQQTMAWAHAAGYETCLAHWATASRAARFWQRHGFRPLSHWLCRSVDARASWATSGG